MSSQNDNIQDYEISTGWIPLTDYSVKYGISVSSLRRYIKEHRVAFQKVRGKYLLEDVPQQKKKRGRKPKYVMEVNSSSPSFSGMMEQHNLGEVKQLREEIRDLRMYVKVLEEKLGLEPVR